VKFISIYENYITRFINVKYFSEQFLNEFSENCLVVSQVDFDGIFWGLRPQNIPSNYYWQST